MRLAWRGAYFQFFPSCFMFKEKEAAEGERRLSILSQLLRWGMTTTEITTEALTFNSFPVASTAGGGMGASTCSTFNSFPVASALPGAPLGAFPDGRLSILSQLLHRDRCKQEGSRAASSAFNSFPVASIQDLRRGGSRRRPLSILSQLLLHRYQHKSV